VKRASEVSRFGKAMLLDTPLCDFGHKVLDFKLKSFDKKLYARNGRVGAKGFLIAFIRNHCPYVTAIITNFVSDAKKLQSIGIHTAAIMSNNYIPHPTDSTEKMCAFATQNHFGFLYLIDETQSVSKAYGAVCTPDFFGFHSNLELPDRGRLGNLTMGKGDTLTPKLFDAVSMIAATDNGPERQVAAMGLLSKL